ncbi:MAG: hypothetical protein WBW27_24400 [Pseudolabrys sp.]
MRRREFITLVGGATVGWPLSARSQQSGRLPTIGFLGGATASAWTNWSAAFVQRLHELGWSEGRTVSIEYAGLRDVTSALLKSQLSSSDSKSMSSSHRAAYSLL